MHTIVNLTKQVVMLRMNSGAELNIGPEQKLKRVQPSEIRDNAVIAKLIRLQQITVKDDARATLKGDAVRVDLDANSDAPTSPKARSDKKPR